MSVRTVPHFESLAVVFPMYNEEASAEVAVRAAARACEVLVRIGEIGRYEIVVVDDGSTDQTATVVEALSAQNRRILLLRHGRNRGLGGALKTGLYATDAALVLYSDADLPFDMSEVAHACRLLRERSADIVAGYRMGRSIDGAKRVLYSVAYNTLVQAAFGLRVRDVNFSLKLFRRQVLKDVRAVSEGSFIDAELLVRASRRGFKIVQYGVQYFPRERGVSTLSSPRTIARIVQDFVRLYPELRNVERRVELASRGAATNEVTDAASRGPLPEIHAGPPADGPIPRAVRIRRKWDRAFP